MASGAILETLERGFKFRRNPLLFMITNSGSDRNSVAWDEHDRAVRVAAGSIEPLGSDCAFVGEPVDDDTFAYVCALDPEDDPLDDPACWIKANPLLGKTIDVDYLAGVVREARQMPGKLNGILRLHFCVWTEADVAWTTRAAIEPLMADFDPVDEHAGLPVWIGLDLSGNRDMTAAAAIVKTGEVEVQVTREGETFTILKPTFDAWIEAWTPGDNIEARELRDKLPYRVWRDRGFVNAVPGLSIPYLHVAQYLAEIDRDFEVVLAAYDRYAFAKFEEDAATIGLAIPFAEHPQGGVKKGKPTEAMKEAAKAADREPQGLWMPGSVRLLEDAIMEKRIRLRRNPVLMSALLSAVIEADRWGNHWLSKLRSTNKIDAAIALAMAIGAAEAIQDAPSGLDDWLRAGAQ
jgi:phage terminase large subunit-like protein